MRKFKQFGAYGLILKDDNILLIKKCGGPYDGKLDLPGGTIEEGETPEMALKRELLEEVGIEIVDYQLLNEDSITFDWNYKDNIIKVHHTGVFFEVNNYKNEIKNNMKIDEINDDSLGADFYKISKLTKDNLSSIAVLGLEKVGYKL